MTNTEPKREAGYRGALPTRNDRLARPWLLIVAGIFVLIFVLSALQIPSRFVPEPTPTPSPSVTAAPSGSASPEASGSAEASDEASASASVAPSGSPSPSE
jgi:cytoskeletal protein RodZ